MGILTNALEQLTGQILGLGFGQLDDYFTRKIQSGRVEEAAREAAETDNEINQRLLMIENVNQGSFGIPGIGDTTGQMVNPQSPQGQGVLSKLGTLPEIPAAIGQSPLHASLIEHRGKQFIDQNPIVQQMKQREEIQKEILRASGQKVDQNLLGLDELEPTFRNPSLLPRDRILQNLGEKEAAQKKGELQITGPEWDRRQSIKTADQIRVKQTSGAKAVGGGDKPKKPKTATSTDINAIRRFVLERDDKSAPVFTTTDVDPVTGDMTTNISEIGNTIENRAIEIMETERVNPKAAVNKAFAEYKRDISQKKKEAKQAQAPNASKFMEFSQETPAAPERAKEVQTGRDPATENKIKAAKSLGATDAEIKQSLIDEGKNPADYGYR